MQVAVVGGFVAVWPVVPLLTDEAECQTGFAGVEGRAVVAEVQVVRPPAVVEPRRHLYIERDLSPHAPQHADQPVLFAGRVTRHRHEIHQFTDAALREEPCDENSRVGQIELLCGEGLVQRPGTEVAAAGTVQQRSENAGRVETGAAEPIKRPLCGHQRRGLQVTDKTVVRDQWVFIHLDDLPGASAAPEIRTVSGASPAALEATINAFKADAGDRRSEINWDGVPASATFPNRFPGGFFGGPRGAEFDTPGVGTEISNGSPWGGGFQRYSGEKLFAPVGSNYTNVRFNVPGTQRQAFTSGGAEEQDRAHDRPSESQKDGALSHPTIL